MDISTIDLGFATIGLAKTAFFFFYMQPAIKQEDFDQQFNDYLDKFNISENSELISPITRPFVNRLNILKEEFKEHFYSGLESIVEKYKLVGSKNVNEYLKILDENKLELERLMLIIKPECVKNINKTANQEYHYCLYRAYWIEWNFKRKLKFSVSLGKVEDVMNGDEIKEEYIKLGEQLIREKLIEEYKEYYKI
ncbi:MAG: hypothetical protein RLY15_203 [Bacteroidota bacterium]|jgi:hypothetical protein